MKTLLVAVDFSPITTAVLEEAAALVEPPDGRMILIHVTEPTAKIVDFVIVSMSVAQVDEAKVGQAKVQLEHLQRDLADQGIRTDVLNVVGFPVSEIIAAAAQHRADGIVLGSHGHSALHDLLVGSTAAGVVKRAACPVVIIPAPRAKASEPGAAGEIAST